MKYFMRTINIDFERRFNMQLLLKQLKIWNDS
jgi:hypothetical protein